MDGWMVHTPSFNNLNGARPHRARRRRPRRRRCRCQACLRLQLGWQRCAAVPAAAPAFVRREQLRCMHPSNMPGCAPKRRRRLRYVYSDTYCGRASMLRWRLRHTCSHHMCSHREHGWAPRMQRRQQQCMHQHHGLWWPGLVLALTRLAAGGCGGRVAKAVLPRVAAALLRLAEGGCVASAAWLDG
eukprot:361940-Chlamydomonas_euryale.AAC.2